MRKNSRCWARAKNGIQKISIIFTSSFNRSNTIECKGFLAFPPPYYHINCLNVTKRVQTTNESANVVKRRWKRLDSHISKKFISRCKPRTSRDERNKFGTSRGQASPGKHSGSRSRTCLRSCFIYLWPFTLAHANYRIFVSSSKYSHINHNFFQLFNNFFFSIFQQPDESSRRVCKRFRFLPKKVQQMRAAIRKVTTIKSWINK